MAFKSVRRALCRFLFVAIGATLGLFAALRSGVQVLIKGKAILKPKERKEEPACLRDPALGTHEFVTLEDITLHYVSAGNRENPLIMFLHGFPDFWFMWRPQILSFKEDFWVVAPDMRGYGQTSKPRKVEDYAMSCLVEDVRGLLAALGKKKVILVGHDWGGMVAWVFASKYEHMVDRLVILNAPHPMAMKFQMENSLNQMIKSWYMIAFQARRFPEMMMRLNDFEMLDKTHAGFSQEEREALKYTFSQEGALTSAINYYRANIGKKDKKLKDLKFRYLNAPTLILWGEKDAFMGRKLAQLSIQHAFGRVQYFPNASHWVQRECPEKVNDEIRSFLKNTA